MRKLTISLLFVIGLASTALADTTASVQSATNTSVTSSNSVPFESASSIAPVNTPGAISSEAVSSGTTGFNQDLSVWGMYQGADAVVKTVMIGLLVASVLTWTLFFSKGILLLSARRRLKGEQAALAKVTSLDEAVSVAACFRENSVSCAVINEAVAERTLSVASTDVNGVKDRTAYRLDRYMASLSRDMGRGNGYLATIGAISPFIGLFGTVWGIMNSFIGIAHSQTTNLAVVAPGIAEALLATAIGLIAAIPAVVIYNIFARMINHYRGQVGDVAAQVSLLLGRDLDLVNSKTR